MSKDKKSAKEYWAEKFHEYPQTDAEKLAVVMMVEYANYVQPAEVNKAQEDEQFKKALEEIIHTTASKSYTPFQKVKLL